MKIRIEAKWTRTETGSNLIEVDIPDDGESCHAYSAAERWVERQRPDADGSRVEVEYVHWYSLAPGAVRASIPDPCWMEVDGHRWASNGHVLIRDDCGIPFARGGWLGEEGERPLPTADGIRSLLRPDVGPMGRASRRVSVYYRPILESGEARFTGFRWEVSRNGELIAVVMGMEGDDLDSFVPVEAA
jgi:hypothetical protein